MKRKKHKTSKSVGHRPIFLALGLMLSVGLFVFSWLHSSVILPGVQVAGVHVSGLRPAQAEQAVVAALQTRTYTLEYGSRAWTATASQLGLSFNVQGSLREAHSVHRSRHFMASNVSIEPMVAVNTSVLTTYLSTLGTQLFELPKNATLVFENGVFTVAADQPGYTFSTQAAAQVLTQGRTVELQLGKQEAQIQVTDVQPLLSQANAIVAKNFGLVVEGKHVDVSAEQLRSWLTVAKGEASSPVVASLEPVDTSAPQAELSLDPDKVGTFLKQASATIEVAPVPEQVLQGSQRLEVVVDGKPGKQLAITDAVQKVSQAVLRDGAQTVQLALTETPRPIKYLDPPAAPVAEGKVVAVDITKQHAYLFDNGSLVYSMKVSTGINDWTPTGTFHVYAKTKSQKMSGPGYWIPNVPNILWFKGDYSLHGVYWHNDFGIRPRSHGCVGQSVVDSAFTYDWAQVGTPIVIYKS